MTMKMGKVPKRSEDSSTQFGERAHCLPKKTPRTAVYVWQSWDGTKYECRHTIYLTQASQFIDLYELMSDVVGFFALTIGDSEDIMYLEGYPTREKEKEMLTYWNTHSSL